MTAAFTWDAVTDIGLGRHENEDSFAVVPERGLFVVCDGMGGHAKGAEASAAACEAIRTTIEETPRSRRAEPVRALLSQAISAANERVHGLGQGIRRPGTTVAALLVTGASVVIAHLGESRVYRLRDRGLEQLTIDHRVPFTRNVLTRALDSSPHGPAGHHGRASPPRGRLPALLRRSRAARSGGDPRVPRSRPHAGRPRAGEAHVGGGSAG